MAVDATWLDEDIVGLTVTTIASDELGVGCDTAAVVQMAVGSRAGLVADSGGVVVVESLESLVRREGFTKVDAAVDTAGRSGTTTG